MLYSPDYDTPLTNFPSGTVTHPHVRRSCSETLLPQHRQTGSHKADRCDNSSPHCQGGARDRTKVWWGRAGSDHLWRCWMVLNGPATRRCHAPARVWQSERAVDSDGWLKGKRDRSDPAANGNVPNGTLFILYIVHYHGPWTKVVH